MRQYPNLIFKRFLYYVRCNMKLIAFSLVAMIFAGCTPTWQKTSGPDIQGTNGLASVMSFVATHGWNMHSETNKYIFWEESEPTFYIADLPWKKWRGQRFQALTKQGILYVLVGDEFHNDYYGVAYNPNTNHFPEWIRGFEPIGDHWYVWEQPEFWYTTITDGRYE
jgi:hypothetical protein